ncbi:hypothetical protein P7C73_g6267, partial [Tremellales sp. Uapishka_1]
NQTSRSQPDNFPKPPTAIVRKPGSSMGTFQFPLTQQPPMLSRMHSAAPTVPLPIDSPPRPFPLPTTQHLPPPQALGMNNRPMMMRQASVAVMEGRSASQIQHQQAKQQSPTAPGKNPNLHLGVGLGGRPGTAGAMGVGVGMMRSRSGSRVDTDGPAMGLRDLMKLSPAVPDISDLLPPSPSVPNNPSTTQRFFPTPSPLSLPSGLPPSQIPIQKQPPPPVLPPAFPVLRPLDLSDLEGDDVFEELERTVENLGKWLSIVGDGLEGLIKTNSAAGEDEGIVV